MEFYPFTTDLQLPNKERTHFNLGVLIKKIQFSMEFSNLQLPNKERTHFNLAVVIKKIQFYIGLSV